jgi:excisionase family DNA binding protein
MQQLLSAREVSETLKLPLQRIYDLTRRGALPAVRVFRQYRYNPDALRQWIDRGGTSASNGDHDEEQQAALSGGVKC